MGATNYAVSFAQFASDMSEFTNQPYATESSVNYWSALAYQMINSSLWSTLYTLGAELFIAHHLVLEALESGTVATNGIPGVNTGAVSSESFGSMSVSYNSESVLEEKAGHWNYTRYGTRFIHLAKQFGAGPQTIGPSGGPGVTAWGGPPYFPWG